MVALDFRPDARGVVKRSVLATLTFLVVCAVLWAASPSSPAAQVVLTFTAKRAEDSLGIPHSYVRIGGTTQSGEVISRTFGFMPVEQSSFLALGDRVRGAVIDEPESSIQWELVTPHISVQIPDATLDAVILRFRYWNENQNGGYDAYVQNCIAFLADIARTIGLKVPPGNHLSPGGFLSELAKLNPPGSQPGILPVPVPNPVPLDPTVEAWGDADPPPAPEPETTPPDPAPAELQPTPN